MLCNTKYIIYFLGAFVKHLRLGTISFVMSVRHSFYKEYRNSSHLKNYFVISYLDLFTEICRKHFEFGKNRTKLTDGSHEDLRD